MFTRQTLIINSILSIIFMSFIIISFKFITKYPLQTKEVIFLYFIGFILSFLGTIIDVFRFKGILNKLNKKGREVNKQKEYSEYINEVVPTGIFVTNKNYDIINWNTHAEKITGYKKDEIIGKNYLDIAKQIFSDQCALPSDQIYQEHILVDREYLITAKNHESKFIKKNTALLVNNFGETDGLIGSFSDITHQKSLEAELIDLHDKVGLYLDTAKMIFLILNTKGNIVMINERGATMLGYTKQELLGQSWINYVPEKIRPRIKDVFQDLLSEELDFVDYYENEVIKKDGSLLTIGWNNSLVKNDDGKIEGILSAGVDLTNQKEFEDLLKYHATIDDMTKLYNRRTGLEMLKKHHSLSRRYHRIFTICFIDLNGLKNINDTFGHEAGDLYIIKVSEIIQFTIRDADIACRLGGDEFLIIFPEADLVGSKLVIDRIIVLLNEFNHLNKTDLYSISFGFSTFDGNSADDVTNKGMDQMVAEADQNMYAMKETFKKLK